MEVYVNEIRGLADAICTLYLSKRNIDRDKEIHIRNICSTMIDHSGMVIDYSRYEEYGLDKTKLAYINEVKEEFDKYIESVVKYGVKHTTLLRYLDFSCSVYGLHRGGQDDFDSHSKRLENRIVRSSTRLAKYGPGEKSDYYKGKILTTDEVLDIMGTSLPEKIEYEGNCYVRAVNGYVREEFKDDNDVLRGLYMLSIPSNFIFKCNIIEFAHIVVMRDKYSTAAPELREMIEKVLEQLTIATGGLVTRKFLYTIERFTRDDIVIDD